MKWGPAHPKGQDRRSSSTQSEDVTHRASSGQDTGNQGDREERRRKHQSLNAFWQVATGKKRAPKFWIPRLTGGGLRRQTFWPGRSHSYSLLSRPAVRRDDARSIMGSFNSTSDSYGPEGAQRGLWVVEVRVSCTPGKGTLGPSLSADPRPPGLPS